MVAGATIAPEPGSAHRADAGYPELDALRGLAAIAFVVFTVYQFSNVDHFLYKGTPAYTILNSLDAAVPLFFVVTAFLLFRPVAEAAINGERPISAPAFITRRALRVLPVYYLAVALVWFSRQRTLPGNWRDLLEHLTFTQVFDEKRIFFTLGPGWAIAVAVFFYLLVLALNASLVPLCRRIVGRDRRIAVLLGAISLLALLSIAWKAWAFSGGQRPSTGSFTVWFGPLANLDIFAAGMVLAVIAAARERPREPMPRTRVALVASSLALLTVAFVLRDNDGWSGVYFSTICGLGFALMTGAIVLGRSRLGASMSGPRPAQGPLLALGLISYSVFVWEEPVLLELRRMGGIVRQTPGAFVANTLVVTAASIVVGAISYLVIEQPFRRLARVTSDPSSDSIRLAELPGNLGDGCTRRRGER